MLTEAADVMVRFYLVEYYHDITILFVTRMSELEEQWHRSKTALATK